MKKKTLQICSLLIFFSKLLTFSNIKIKISFKINFPIVFSFKKHGQTKAYILKNNKLRKYRGFPCLVSILVLCFIRHLAGILFFVFSWISINSMDHFDL